MNYSAAGLLCFFLYWMAQTILALMPIEKLRILFLVKAAIVPPTFLALFLWGAIVTHGGGPLVTGDVVLTSSYMNTAYSALTGLNAIIGLFSSMAVNMPVGTSTHLRWDYPLSIPLYYSYLLTTR